MVMSPSEITGVMASTPRRRPGTADSGLRAIDPPFVASGPCGVAVRNRLKGLTALDEQVLRQVGAHLGSLASRDLKARCADGLEHGADTWATRKRS